MKKKSKKILTSIITIGLFSMCFLPMVVGAQGGPVPPQETLVTSTSDITRILGNIQKIMWAILFIVIVIMFIWAAITFVTAEGDPSKLEKARNRMLYGVIGIVIGLLASGIFFLVSSVMK